MHTGGEKVVFFREEQSLPDLLLSVSSAVSTGRRMPPPSEPGSVGRPPMAPVGPMNDYYWDHSCPHHFPWLFPDCRVLKCSLEVIFPNRFLRQERHLRVITFFLAKIHTTPLWQPFHNVIKPIISPEEEGGSPRWWLPLLLPPIKPPAHRRSEWSELRETLGKLTKASEKTTIHPLRNSPPPPW